MIFEIIDIKTIKINIVELLTNQKLINDKFPNPNRESDFINVFDNMVGQINEEIYETKEALYNNQRNNKSFQTNDSLEEFIDSIMYIGSLIIETANYFDIDFDQLINFLKENKLDKITINDTYVLDSLYTKNKPCTEWLDYIRRFIYDRKYHKPASVKPNNYEKQLIKMIIISCFYPKKTFNGRFEVWNIPEFIENMNPYCQDVLFCYDNNTVVDDNRIKNIKQRIADLNNIIKTKQSKIANL